MQKKNVRPNTKRTNIWKKKKKCEMKMWTVNNIEKEENKNTKAKWSKYEKKKLTAFTGKNRLLWEEEQKNMKHNEITLGFLSFSFFFFSERGGVSILRWKAFQSIGNVQIFFFSFIEEVVFYFFSMRCPFTVDQEFVRETFTEPNDGIVQQRV